MNQLHFIPVDLGSPIVQCAVADPCVVIMSAEGHITMFLLKSDSYGGRHHRLALHKPPLHHVGSLLRPWGLLTPPAPPLSPPIPAAVQGDYALRVPGRQRHVHHREPPGRGPRRDGRPQRLRGRVSGLRDQVCVGLGCRLGLGSLGQAACD